MVNQRRPSTRSASRTRSSSTAASQQSARPPGVAPRRSGQTEIDPSKDLIQQVGRKFGKRALCIFAHPDDLEFSSGGTVARLCAEGWRVDIIEIGRAHV